MGGLIPYASTLGSINPLTVLTHRHTIARPAHVLTAPTTLESTSLVVGVGLDLFLTRTAPAREFDRLNDDFNYVALLAPLRSSSSPPSGRAGTLNGATCSPHGGEGWCKHGH